MGICKYNNTLLTPTGRDQFVQTTSSSSTSFLSAGATHPTNTSHLNV